MRFSSFLIVSLCVAVAASSAHAATPRKASPALERALWAAPASRPVAAWVFFADKGDAPALFTVESRLTPKARERRERNRGTGNLVGPHDIPVSARYVDAIRNRGADIRHISRWLNAVSVNADAATLARIAELGYVQRMDVVRASREPMPQPVALPAPSKAQGPQSAYTLDYGTSLTQNLLINVPALHDAGLSGNGVLVAMFDSGFNNLTHNALIGIDVQVTRDFVNGDSVVSNEVGQMGNGNHGTYTLSTIAGYAPGQLIGPAFGATYILCKTENTEWERYVEEDAWVAAAEWVDSLGADIISSSLSYLDGYTHSELGYTWEDMDGNTTIVTIGADIAASNGILVVNSAGNGGFVSLPENTLGGPADGDDVLAVGAVDGTGVRSNFSSVGPTSDGRIKPDVMAMGSLVKVASTLDAGSYFGNSGTSFSCPLTAGVCALLLEARPNASNTLIMSAIRQTASQSGAPDRLMGWGIVNAAAAADVIPTGVGDAPLAVRTILHPAHPNPFNPTTTIDYEIAARANVDLTVYDVRGARVANLVNETQDAGRHRYTWNARDARGGTLASGVYFYRLTVGGVAYSRKMVLLK